MIQDFADKDAERLFRRERPRRLPADLHRAALKKLWMLDAAVRLEDLRMPPGNHLEKLSKDRKDQYSIRIHRQWRVCFVWTAGGPDRVEIVDYHG
ncbi:MAG: type II toxin-antitoxin system RelE/ParE family toxin [Planctomycetes bacterium]|nr:type II toxin-antitoxin system RelE/ParE family toxin [Planctomycetota bacterium]